ncbi:MAG: Rpn family recombination-promoting nuclease/putative transposase [Lachnospiraceae bacterium]|nr:Rpn family recombination-promoting nuclease/putative transposase [Lachnospiraceae bacterium]
MNQKTMNQQITNQQDPVSNLNEEFQNAHGKIPYGMTNDYMFRAVLQSNNKALRGLICSLLHLRHEDVLSVEITNPIILGESIEDKEFMLDINVNMNNNTLINLEMQMTEKLVWSDRSISYLCRSLNMLTHGQEYQELKPVIHIGFLNYTLFDDYPEFYATYKLMNVKNHHIYSDKLTLSVVDLSQIELATDEDREYNIDNWAKLFKATTWEEIKMLAAEDKYIDEASKSIFQLSAEEQISKRCFDRMIYYREKRFYEKTIEEQKAEIADKDAEIQKLLTEIESLKAAVHK